MEGSETGGAWMGTGLGREDAVELGWDGKRKTGGAWVGLDGGGRGWGGKMEGSETGLGSASVWTLAGTWLHHKHHCRLLREWTSRTKHGWG